MQILRVALRVNGLGEGLEAESFQDLSISPVCLQTLLFISHSTPSSVVP